MALFLQEQQSCFFFVNPLYSPCILICLYRLDDVFHHVLDLEYLFFVQFWSWFEYDNIVFKVNPLPRHCNPLLHHNCHKSDDKRSFFSFPHYICHISSCLTLSSSFSILSNSDSYFKTLSSHFKQTYESSCSTINLSHLKHLIFNTSYSLAYLTLYLYPLPRGEICIVSSAETFLAIFHNMIHKKKGILS